jgi:hypothetical protein
MREGRSAVAAAVGSSSWSPGPSGVDLAQVRATPSGGTGGTSHEDVDVLSATPGDRHSGATGCVAGRRRSGARGGPKLHRARVRSTDFGTGRIWSIPFKKTQGLQCFQRALCRVHQYPLPHRYFTAKTRGLKGFSAALLACKSSYRCLYKRNIPSLFIGLTSRSLRAQTKASTRSGEYPARCRWGVGNPGGARFVNPFSAPWVSPATRLRGPGG